MGAEYITSMFLARSNKYFSYVASRRPQWSILGADTLDRKSPGGGIRQFSIKGERSSKHAFADRTERDSAVAQLPGWAEVKHDVHVVLNAYKFHHTGCCDAEYCY